MKVYVLSYSYSGTDESTDSTVMAFGSYKSAVDFAKRMNSFVKYGTKYMITEVDYAK